MRQCRNRRISALFACALLTFFCTKTPFVLAGDWRLTDSFTSSLTWSSNPGRDSSSDEEASLIVSASPSFTLRGEGRRASADIAYRLSADQSLSGRSRGGISNFLNANADLEAVRDHLFINASASAGLLDDSSGRTTDLATDSISNTFNGDVSQTYTLSVSPEWRNRFGSFANSTVSTRFDLVESGSGASTNSTMGEVGWLLSSGRDFPRLPWSISASTNKISYANRDNESGYRVIGQVSHRYSRQWSLRANAGYEDYDVDTSRSDTNGVTWGLGAGWTPNSRTSLDVNYENRYFGSAWDVGFTRRSKRTTISANFSRGVTSARNSLLDSPFIDPNTGNTDPFFLPTIDDEDFLENSADLSIGLQGKRTQASMNIRWSNSEGEVSGDTEDTLDVSFGLQGQRTQATIGAGWSQTKTKSSGDKQDTQDIYFTLNREFRSQFNANFSLFWQNDDDDEDSNSDTLDIRFELNKAIGRDTSVGVSVSRRDEGGGRDDSSTDNRIAIYYTTSFL